MPSLALLAAVIAREAAKVSSVENYRVSPSVMRAQICRCSCCYRSPILDVSATAASSVDTMQGLIVQEACAVASSEQR